MKEMRELEDKIKWMNENYETVCHMGETFYLSQNDKSIHMIGSYYNEENEKEYRLEEVGVYDTENGVIVFD